MINWISGGGGVKRISFGEEHFCLFLFGYQSPDIVCGPNYSSKYAS